MVGVGHKRDPVSILLDGAARRLLDRAYARPGAWQPTRLADPGPRTRLILAALGVNWRGPDDSTAIGGVSGGLDARDRWGRALVRALYYQHTWFSPSPGHTGWRDQPRTEPRHSGALRVDVGRRLPAAGVIPAGRQVRVRLDKGGELAHRAVRRKGDQGRIYDDRGDPAGRWSDPGLRDWRLSGASSRS